MGSVYWLLGCFYWLLGGLIGYWVVLWFYKGSLIDLACYSDRAASLLWALSLQIGSGLDFTLRWGTGLMPPLGSTSYQSEHFR